LAKPKKLPAPSTPDAARAIAQAETPRIKWNVVLQIALAVIVVWALAIGSIPYVDYWGVGVVGVLTLVLAGFGIWIWNFTRKQRGIVEVLKQATDEAGRKNAIAQLEARGSKDAMAALARAQLMLRDDPKEAMTVLEAIDLKREPGPVQDEVRSNLAFLYLAQNRPKDARPLADELRLDRQPNAKAKAMYAAVMAETFARTGKPEEAKKLLETYSADDPEYGEVAVVLLRAQVYTYLATKNRGLMRKAMTKIAAIDPNQLGPFAMKGASPELQAAVREVLAGAGFATRAKTKISRQ
jgi:predicted Zn-dependent protease